MPERLRNSIKERRSNVGMTQAELAVLVGVSRKTINTIENSVFVPSTIIALKLSRALYSPVEELFMLPDEEGEVADVV